MRRRGRRSVHLFCLLQRIIVVVVVFIGGGGGGTVAFCRGVRAAEDEEGRASSVSSFRAASRVTRNTNTNTNNNNNNNNNNDELLRHWLFSLQLQIPDERFSAFDDTIAISLTDIECQNSIGFVKLSQRQ